MQISGNPPDQQKIFCSWQSLPLLIRSAAFSAEGCLKGGDPSGKKWNALQFFPIADERAASSCPSVKIGMPPTAIRELALLIRVAAGAEGSLGQAGEMHLANPIAAHRLQWKGRRGIRRLFIHSF